LLRIENRPLAVEKLVYRRFRKLICFICSVHADIIFYSRLGSVFDNGAMVLFLIAPRI
jgi:hypothetical protein